MARGEFVENTFWDEMAEFSRDATYLYIWARTNAKCNMAGLYFASERALMESKVTRRGLEKALGELQEAGKVYYDKPLIWVVKRVAHLHTRAPGVAKAISKDVS